MTTGGGPFSPIRHCEEPKATWQTRAWEPPDCFTGIRNDWAVSALIVTPDGDELAPFAPGHARLVEPDCLAREPPPEHRHATRGQDGAAQPVILEGTPGHRYPVTHHVAKCLGIDTNLMLCM